MPPSSFCLVTDVLKSFYTLKQDRDETLENYYKRFEASVESVKLSYGSLTNLEKLIVLTEKDNTSVDFDSSFLCKKFVFTYYYDLGLIKIYGMISVLHFLLRWRK